MNRHERRGSLRRAQGPHANQSFQELVSQKNLENLKPYIDSQVQQLGQFLAQQQLASSANMLTRLSVLEELAKEKLGETEDSLAERTAAREDAALGYVSTSEAAKRGDMVRISFRLLEEDKEPKEFVRSVVRKLDTDPIQFHPDVELAVVGMRAGETTQVVLSGSPTTNHETGETAQQPDQHIEVRVDRVSVKPTQEGDNANA